MSTIFTMFDTVRWRNLHSIVAVHGLGAHPFFTWTATIDPSHTISTKNSITNSHGASSRVSWLKNFLPKRFPNARIMIFSHNADWIIDAPHTTSYNTAIDLLSSLKKEGVGEKVQYLYFIHNCRPTNKMLSSYLEPTPSCFRGPQFWWHHYQRCKYSLAYCPRYPFNETCWGMIELW